MMEIDFQPVGNFMLCSPFALPVKESIIDETDNNKRTIAPILEVIRTGPNCVIKSEGMFVYTSNQTLQRAPGVVIKNKMYLLIQEISAYGFFKEKPELSDIIETDDAYAPEITDYVKVDKASQMKLNFETPVRD